MGPGVVMGQIDRISTSFDAIRVHLHLSFPLMPFLSTQQYSNAVQTPRGAMLRWKQILLGNVTAPMGKARPRGSPAAHIEDVFCTQDGLDYN